MKPEGDRPREGDPYTYADAMNDWASGQQSSFLRRVKGGILHPSRAETALGRCLGYGWRVLLVTAVVLAVIAFAVRRHVGGGAFAAELGEEIARVVSAQEVDFSALRWKGSKATCPQFEIVGGQDSFFHTMRGEYLRFERPFWSLFSAGWQFEEVSILQLDVHVRSGGLVGVPVVLPAGGGAERSGDGLPGLPATDLEPTPMRDLDLEFEVLPAPEVDMEAEGDLDAGGFDFDTSSVPDPGPSASAIRTAGFGVSPSLELGSVERLRIERLDLRWGQSTYTEGRLEGAPTMVARDPSGTWKLTARGGSLQQGMWSGIEIDPKFPFEAEIGDGSVRLRGEGMRLGGGTVSVDGSVVMSAIPALDVRLALADVRLEALFPPASLANRILLGRVSGTARLGGSTNTRTGVTTKLAGTLSDGVLRNLPLLDFLALPTGHDAFRRLPIEAGTFSLEVEMATVTIESFDLTAAGDIGIRGRATRDQVGYSGVFEIGVPPRLLEGFPGLRAKYFEPGPDGKLWMTCPLEGAIGDLTRPMAERCFADFKAEEEARRGR